MTMKLYSEDDINAIAEAINEKGVTGTFTVGEMADAVMEISGGGGGGGVEPTTSLVLNSNKLKTTGAVTLTAQLMTDRYYSSDDVSENGFVEGATITFYKMVGSTPNPSSDITLNTSITNSTGTCVEEVTLTETSNIYAHFTGITGIPTVNSNVINVIYDNWRTTYQEVEWIGSNGNPYIDADFIPTNNTRIEFKMQHTHGSVGKWEGICGVHNNDNKRYAVFMHLQKATYNFGSFGIDDAFSMPQNTPLVITLDKNNYSLNDSIGVVSSHTINCINNFYIFRTNGLSDICADIKIYYFKVYENDELIRDFVPVYRKSNNVIGLLDISQDTSVFYTNDGSGSFTKGEDI